MLALLLLALPPMTAAVPLYAGAVSPATESGFQPLAIALSLLPLPILAAIKYGYLRFRRSQSIHAAGTTVSSKVSPGSLTASASQSSPLSRATRPPSPFWQALHPYLVGFLGSPDWETTISCRIHKTIRRAHCDRSSPSTTLSPGVANSTRSTRATDPSTNYSSLSTKSRATTHSSRSKHLSASFADRSRTRLPLNDFAVMPTRSSQHASPRLPQIPQPAHLSTSSVRFSVRQKSPTLMQVMQPVLSSWDDDSKSPPKPPVVLVNDKSISSLDSSNQERSASAGDDTTSFAGFFTPLSSPQARSPHLLRTCSTNPSVAAFTQLRKQHTISATSSMLTISAASATSPTSLSIAIFHSPVAPSIPVPQPVYTPSLRPESCVVLPRNWVNDNDKENTVASSILQSPTHCSPTGDAPTIFDCLANRTDRVPLGMMPLNLTKLANMPKTPSVASQSSSRAPLQSDKSNVASPALSSLRNSTASDNRSSTASYYLSPQPTGKNVTQRKSWDLAELSGDDGRLDIDAVTRALGLGLGLGFASASASRSTGASSGLGATESESEVYALLTPVPESEDESQADSTLQTHCPGSCSRAFGWDSRAQDGSHDSIANASFLYGQPLCVIPEETRSEVGSVMGTVCAAKVEDTGDSRVVSMELDSEIVERALLRASETLKSQDTPSGENRLSGFWDRSWVEGESTRLSIGVAW
ncbi:hypothetical protein C8Q80DRAFT_1149447 [Daedaleopsis nitida]|nr:hypothetical protein C8Q80DRAFT_1149447 [Daedaleopsis nitida]